MAVSLGLFSVFSTGVTASFAKSDSFSSVRLASPLAAHHVNNLRTVRTVTFATASKPVAEPKKREPRGIMKPRRVSPEMQAFLGGMSEVPRTQALKLIWAHIKANDLQDPQNKKVIICDEKLKTIFGGKERVGFLEIAGLISPHFLK
ncbi:SWIB_MDM2 domain protein precursor [Solanum lycopersicum]|uniref:DM2 domain-containing protein n=1 Tax=Solanum lycopersicum TaxID=4081 RepID=A0A3Q7ES73_SOLLC|nr:SWIB_MDM2 domain protein precursor [Solanum lycopersicum]